MRREMGHTGAPEIILHGRIAFTVTKAPWSLTHLLRLPLLGVWVMSTRFLRFLEEWNTGDFGGIDMVIVHG